MTTDRTTGRRRRRHAAASSRVLAAGMSAAAALGLVAIFGLTDPAPSSAPPVAVPPATAPPPQADVPGQSDRGATPAPLPGNGGSTHGRPPSTTTRGS